MDRTMSFTDVNTSHFGNKSKRMSESMNSGRTINKSMHYQDEGEYCRSTGVKVIPHTYRKPQSIFENVVRKSRDTNLSITG